MRCIAANRSILTAIDQNATLPDHDGSNCTAMTNDIDSMDTVQFADGWYSYPDLNTFDSNVLLDVLTIRNIKPTKVISPWNVKADNPASLPLTEIATRQLEALFNLSQLLFGLARAEQSNYTFRDLQLGQPPRTFREAGFKKFPNSNRSIDFFATFQLLVNDIFKSSAIDVVFMMYKDPRLRCVKQKSLDFLTNVATISDMARFILDRHSQFIIQLIQGIRDGHLIEEKIPSLSLLLRLCKVIVEKNLLNFYQHLIDMQLIDILIDLFQNEHYKSPDYMIYFIKFESFALQCLHLILQSAEHVDMWSEKAQIRLVNYCCTLLYKSVLDDNNDDHRSHRKEINHIMYAEEHGRNHSLSYGILTFLSVVRCRKEIGKFYRENEHFRELVSVMKQKYASRDPSIAEALSEVVHIMFERHQRKKRRQGQQLSTKDYHRHPIEEKEVENTEDQQYRKCANSLCQMVENDQIQFEDCPQCHQLSYCSQYCREVHWTLNHNLSCRSMKSNIKKEESTVLCTMNRFSGMVPSHSHENKTTSMFQTTAFETLPVQISKSDAEITNDLCYPSSSSSSSSTGKKKSFKTLLSLLRGNGKRR